MDIKQIKDQKQQEEIKNLIRQGYKVLVDNDGCIVHMFYWHPDIIVSKIM